MNKDLSIVITPTEQLAYWLIQDYFEYIELPRVLSVFEWILEINPFLRRNLVSVWEERVIWQFILQGSKFLVYQEDLMSLFYLTKHWNLTNDQIMFSSDLEGIQEKYKEFCNFLKIHQLICNVDLLDKVSLIGDNYHITLVGFNDNIPQERIFLDKLRQQKVICNYLDIYSNIANQMKIRFGSYQNELDVAISWIIDQPEGKYGIILYDFQKQLPIAIHLLKYKNFDNYNVVRTLKLIDTSIGTFLKYLLDPPTYLTKSFWQTFILSPLWGNWEKEVVVRHLLFQKVDNCIIPECSLSMVMEFADASLLSNLELIAVFWESLNELYSLDVWIDIWLKFLNEINFATNVELLDEQIEVLNQIRSQMFKLSKRSNWFPKISGYLAGKLFCQALHEDIIVINKKAKINFISQADVVGVKFDALWVTQCDEKKWPDIVRLNPCLDISWQQALNLPHSSYSQELKYAKFLLDNYKKCAKQVVFSYSQDEENLEFSPLIHDVSEVGEEFFLSKKVKLKLAKKLQLIPQVYKAKSLNSRLSLQILEEQGKCPFRAFLKYYLKINPRQNLIYDKRRERGIKLHKFLADYYRHCSFGNVPVKELEEQYIDNYLLDEELIEKQCLKRIIMDWFSVEKKRPVFRVIEIENEYSLKILNQVLNLRIDRLDLVGNDYYLIDYKTGNTSLSISNWNQDRMSNLQIPLYLLSNPEINYFGIAYLIANKVKLLTCSVKEIASKFHKDKDGLLEYWRLKIEDLAKDFISGRSEMNPIDVGFCNNCMFRCACRLV